jgi:hypothetical protein
MHLCIAYKKFEEYRNSLDVKCKETFGWPVIEMAGMQEEMRVMHHDQTEARLTNILVEMEMRLQNLETGMKSN